MYWVRADWGESEPLILISVRNGSASNQTDGISVNMGRSRFRAFAGWPIFLLFIGFLLWVFFKAPQILILDSISWNWIKARGLRVYLRIFLKKFSYGLILKGFARVQKNSDSSEIGLLQRQIQCRTSSSFFKAKRGSGATQLGALVQCAPMEIL